MLVPVGYLCLGDCCLVGLWFGFGLVGLCCNLLMLVVVCYLLAVLFRFRVVVNSVDYSWLVVYLIQLFLSCLVCSICFAVVMYL